MVLNAAVKMIREAEELKQNILKFKSDTSMLQERSLWPSQQQLQKIYQKVLVLDLDYALDKKVEQDLWNVGFKQQIEALQTISKDRKNPLRGEAQAMLAWVLQAAAGFYLCLLHQICTAFKLDLPFRRRASLLGWVEGWRPHGPGASARLPPPAAARYICQHCLVHLGDLARYRQQPRVAYTFYRHALVVSTHSGQPYNQLALLARRRGRRLGALYWHVRAVLVRAPFPPAPANLLRTLQHASHNVRDQPVIPGVRRSAPAQAAPAARLDAHTHVTELMRAMCLIHTLEDLEFAATLVNTLNTSLTALVATDCFESMTLIKMVCVIIWLVHSATEDLTLGASALSAAEAAGAALSEALAAGALLALTLPAHTADQPPSRALPALKVYLQWAVLYPQLLDSAPFQARPQIWHALAHTLNKLKGDSSVKYNSVPLPEDEELHGFQPLEESFSDLKFANHATWETYGRRFPDVDGDKGTDTDDPPPSVVSPACLNNDPEVEAMVRAHRLIKLGQRLAELRPDHLTYTTEDSVDTFVALCHGGEQLTQALAELQAAAAPRGSDGEMDSEDDAPLPAPIVISEADFREKVRDKRVGILKPQGSLERAREERALATNDEQESDAVADGSAGEDRRGARRPRVNIAMAAILRKQEETCKQVKFRTPPPVSEETEIDLVSSEATISAVSTAMDRAKPTPPRQPKSLANIPVGRKTGGILALKDKSGYPHLVDVPTVTTVRQEKVQYKDPKVIQPPTQGQKRETQKWHNPYEHRPNKNYGIQEGLTYSPNYHRKPLDDNGIRLSVVNPKEIDVRSAALQKQNARVDYGVQKSDRSDKKSFLEDLPPRFATQKYFEQQTNRFRDEDYRLHAELLSTPTTAWLNPLTLPLASRQPSHPLGLLDNQLTMPQPQMALPDSFSPRNWWKQAYPPVTNSQTHSQTMQQIYGNQIPPYMPHYNPPPSMARPELSPSYGRPSPIGQQLPPRHIPPPNYNPYPPLPYPNMHENFPIYNRGFVEERYQPQLEQGLDLSMNKATNLDLFVPTYDSRRTEELGLDRATDESLGGIPLDLSMKSEPEDEQQETPAPHSATYSLFSGGPGSWGQVGPSQQSLWGAPKPSSPPESGEARRARDPAY